MKAKRIAVISAGIILAVACTKNNGSNPNPNPPPGGGGGGGNNGALSVTSISPANPYPDDEFIINGTGFNSNASLDTVEFGHMTGNNFGAWHDGVPDQYASLCNVISATATQLKVKAVNPFTLDYNSYNSTPFATASVAVAQIRVGNKKAVTPVIPFKRLMAVNWIKDPENNNIAIGRPADSLVIGGSGFNKTGVSVSIGSTTLQNIKVDSTSSSGTIGARLSKTFFGSSNDETATETKTVTVTNADGKSLHKDFSFYVSPRMVISNVHAEHSSYSLSGLTGSGGVIKILISGRNLKSDATMETAGYLNGVHIYSNFGVSGFPDSLTIELGPSSFLVGSYTCTIWRNNVLYGSCTFTVTQ